MDRKLTRASVRTWLRFAPASCLMFAISGSMFAFSLVFYLLSRAIT